MKEIWNALVEAMRLIISFDPEVMDIAWRSLRVSAAATLLSAAICIPLGSLINFNEFKGKRFLINIIQTLYSVPTVCVGLFVYLVLSRAGPLGSLRLLFTPAAIIIAEAILIAPIMTGLTISSLSGVDKAIKDTTLSLGATRIQAMWTILKEARFAIVAGLILGFGRAISEVGAALIAGGNFAGYTRVLTTAINLETQKGNIVLALALGIILLLLAL
ncbi:MAG: ABC transporter permease, partial [Chloroflexi bacterium]|nr:ABC transporter permease [Chloroflexota bacterium]